MAESTVSEDDRESLRARAARERAAVLSRVANARLAVVGCVAAATCGLAVYVGATAPRSSTASHQRAASGTVQSLFGGGSVGDQATSAPGASSGQGDAVSGGS